MLQPFHDGHEGGGAFGARLGQAVELLDLGEGDIHHGTATGAHLTDHLRQPVQGLGTEHQVHVGRAFAQRLALLAGHAAAHADNQLRALLLQLAPLSQLREHLFLRLFADRAGVEQQHVRLFGRRCQLQTMGVGEHVHHLGGIVLVHLAPVGFDKYFSGHGYEIGVERPITIRETGRVLYRESGG